MSKGSLMLSAALLAGPVLIAPAAQAVEASVYVFAPPSNVRAYPNGPVQCQVRAKQNIYVFTDTVQGSWYETYFCGRKGWIHDSQFAWN